MKGSWMTEAGRACPIVLVAAIAWVTTSCAKDEAATKAQPEARAPSAFVLPNSTVVQVRPSSLRAYAPDGRKLWEVALDPATPVIGKVAVARDSTIYIRDTVGLRALTPEGKWRWKQPLPKPSGDTPPDAYSPAALSDSSALALVEKVKYRAFNSEGATLWELPLAANEAPVSAPVAANDGHVYIATATSLVGISPDGHLDWLHKE